MKRQSVRTVCFAALVIGLAAVAAAQDRGCSNASLRGAWGYTETGSVIAPVPPPTGGTVTLLAAAVGKYLFDDEGNFSGDQYSSTSAPGSVVNHDTKQGTYTVNPDCTGMLELIVYKDGLPQRHSFWAIVIVDNGQELRSIMTSMTLPNGVPLSPIMTMTARKLFPGRANQQQ